MITYRTLSTSSFHEDADVFIRQLQNFRETLYNEGFKNHTVEVTSDYDSTEVFIGFTGSREETGQELLDRTIKLEREANEFKARELRKLKELQEKYKDELPK